MVAQEGGCNVIRTSPTDCLDRCNPVICHNWAAVSKDELLCPFNELLNANSWVVLELMSEAVSTRSRYTYIMANSGSFQDLLGL